MPYGEGNMMTKVFIIRDSKYIAALQTLQSSPNIKKILNCDYFGEGKSLMIYVQEWGLIISFIRSRPRYFFAYICLHNLPKV